MPKWINFNPQDIFPDELVESAENIQDTAEALADGVQILADVTRVAATFAQDFSDPQKTLIEEAQNAIYEVTDQLIKTAIYWCWHIPPSFNSRISIEQWLSDMSYSFDDYMDLERPKIKKTEKTGALCIVGTSDKYEDLLDSFRGLFNLFSKLIASEEQTNRWPTPSDTITVSTGVGKEPNWGNMVLLDLISPMGDLTRVLTGYAETISPAKSGLLDSYADFLDQKADFLLNISQSLEDILNTLNTLLDFEGGWVLPIYGYYDTSDLQYILRNTTGGPTDVENSEYTGGVMLLATGGTQTFDYADALFDLFGISTEGLEVDIPEEE